MTAASGAEIRVPLRTLSKAEERKVIFASSLGTVFEWYDFYLYGALAASIAKNFFSGVNPTAAFIFTLLAFAAGFFVRPFGALVFGRLGDLVGRKYTFLVTIVIMGVSTSAVGFLPGYEAIGIAAPVILILLRLLQGLALGGEYGGAATYVAEHAPNGKRGLYTAWIQTTATLGLFLSLIVILVCRASMDAATFDAWGWRIPFLVSIVLLVISIWIRLQLNESPLFQQMKAEGKGSKAPLTESFANRGNLKLVALALFGLTMGQAVVWYCGQFYSLLFLTAHAEGRPPDRQPAGGRGAAGRHAVLPGVRRPVRQDRTQADHHGRLPAGDPDLLPAVPGADPLRQPGAGGGAGVVAGDGDRRPGRMQRAVQPGRHGQVHQLLRHRQGRAGQGRRALQQPGRRRPGRKAEIDVGSTRIAAYDATAADAATAGPAFTKGLGDALKTAGYPPSADPAQINHFMVWLILFVLVLYVTMVYGPIAALLVEMFPTRIRYTSMSLPYHIGNGWFGGFLPATAFAIVAGTGNIYSGLWYPIIIAGITLVVGTLFVRDTRHVDIREI